MVAALKMLVRQDAAADDGEVCVAAEEIMRELLDKAEELVKGSPVNDHRCVLGVHHNGMLVVIDIR